MQRTRSRSRDKDRLSEGSWQQREAGRRPDSTTSSLYRRSTVDSVGARKLVEPSVATRYPRTTAEAPRSAATTTTTATTVVRRGWEEPDSAGPEASRLRGLRPNSMTVTSTGYSVSSAGRGRTGVTSALGYGSSGGVMDGALPSDPDSSDADADRRLHARRATEPQEVAPRIMRRADYSSDATSTRREFVDPAAAKPRRSSSRAGETDNEILRKSPRPGYRGSDYEADRQPRDRVPGSLVPGESRMVDLLRSKDQELDTLRREYRQMQDQLRLTREELQAANAQLQRSTSSNSSIDSAGGRRHGSKSEGNGVRRLRLPDPNTTDLKKHAMLGGNNTVFRCTMGGITFVLKRVQLSDPKAVHETTILEHLDHPNVVKYLGYEQVSSCEINIFMEYVPFALDTFMKRLTAQQRAFKDREIHKIALEVVKGLHYLHCKAPVQIIHRDLKSKNILVDVDADDEIKEVKLCDFGVSKIISADTAPATMVGTYYWMAPEILANDHRGYTCKADIWSYGMVLVELTTLHHPYYENGTNWMRTKAMILAGEAPWISPTAPPKIRDIIHACLRLDPNDRPTTQELVIRLVSD